MEGFEEAKITLRFVPYANPRWSSLQAAAGEN
jgi:hypothetical protein